VRVRAVRFLHFLLYPLRWFVLPWLIYCMIIIVVLSLVAVLRLVIPLGTIDSQDASDWLIAVGHSAALLLAASLLLYFWIVVLELFIR